MDFQYSHYQEGKRDIFAYDSLGPNLSSNLKKPPQNLNPIEVDSVHGSGRFSFTDRIKFAFNYTQDTWSGATPLGTVPAVSGQNALVRAVDDSGRVVAVGASPLTGGHGGGVSIRTDDEFKKFYPVYFNPAVDGALRPNNQLTHVLSYASPETRKQGDFKLRYEWDEAELNIGGGISVENDYESRFGSLGGRFDFNQKATSLSWGLSYTNSDTNAMLDPDGIHWVDTSRYDNSTLEFTGVIDENMNDVMVEIPKKPLVPSGEVDNTYEGSNLVSSRLTGNRQDWGVQLGLTQVLNKDALLSLGLGYTRSTGYLSNPYKFVYTFGYDIQTPPDADGGHGGHGGAVHEHQTGGIGDFGAYGLFKLYGDQHHHLNLVLGGTAPTGDVDIVQRKTTMNPIYNNPLHYCMQLGSGTWDFKPALTYTGEANQFSWGAQVNGTIRLEDINKSGFAFGDMFQGTAWGGYQWTEWQGTTIRGVYTSQGEIRGRYPTIYVEGYDENGNFNPQLPYKDQHIDTFGQPENYGGSYADLGLGLGINVTVPHGAFVGNSLKFEWLQPAYTNFNGYQPDRDYALNVTWNVGF